MIALDVKSPRQRLSHTNRLLMRIDSRLANNGLSAVSRAQLMIYRHLLACEFLNDAGLCHVNTMLELQGKD